MWMQAWSQHEYAGWIWGDPQRLASTIGGSCRFSAWSGGRKVFGPPGEQNTALHPALGPLSSFAGFEWFQIWSAPQLWRGYVTPQFLGWIYTLPQFRGSGSTKAHIGTFVCPQKITIVRNSTGQTVT